MDNATPLSASIINQKASPGTRQGLLRQPLSRLDLQRTALPEHGHDRWLPVWTAAKPLHWEVCCERRSQVRISPSDHGGLQPVTNSSPLNLIFPDAMSWAHLSDQRLLSETGPQLLHWATEIVQTSRKNHLNRLLPKASAYFGEDFV